MRIVVTLPFPAPTSIAFAGNVAFAYFSYRFTRRVYPIQLPPARACAGASHHGDALFEQFASVGVFCACADAVPHLRTAFRPVHPSDIGADLPIALTATATLQDARALCSRRVRRARRRRFFSAPARLPMNLDRRSAEGIVLDSARHLREK
jgi:hypothetical protein